MKIVYAHTCKNPEQMIDQGYEIYKDVLDNLPRPFPVIILPRLRAEFNRHVTLLAVNDDATEVLGIALLEEIHDVKENVGRFGVEAVEAVEAKLKEDSAGGPVYELGGIAVSRNLRNSGLGTAFYQAAAKISRDRVVAVITEANIPSQKTAAKAGYDRLPGVFNAPFTVRDNYATPDAAGERRVTAHLYAPGLNKGKMQP